MTDLYACYAAITVAASLCVLLLTIGINWLAINLVQDNWRGWYVPDESYSSDLKHYLTDPPGRRWLSLPAGIERFSPRQVALFQEFLAEQPEHVYVRFMLGYHYYESGFLKPCIEEWEEVLHIMPDYRPARRYLPQVYAMLQDEARA